MPTATLKLTLWKDNEQTEAKIFGVFLFSLTSSDPNKHLLCVTEIGTPILPRYFLVTSQSGVKSMTLSLDGARERLYAANHAVVECVGAIWTYKYTNGYTVTLRGPLTAHILVIPTQAAAGSSAQGSASHPGYALKINTIEFGSNKFEKYVSVDAVQGTRVENGLGLGGMGGPGGAGVSASPSGSSNAAQTPKTPRLKNSSASASGSTGGQTPVMNGVTVKQEQGQGQLGQGQGQGQEERWEEPRICYERASIPSEPVNAFGIPQATMRCLELAESVGQMSELISFSKDSSLGPIREFPAQLVTVASLTNSC